MQARRHPTQRHHPTHHNAGAGRAPLGERGTRTSCAGQAKGGPEAVQMQCGCGGCGADAVQM